MVCPNRLGRYLTQGELLEHGSGTAFGNPHKRAMTPGHRRHLVSRGVIRQQGRQAIGNRRPFRPYPRRSNEDQRIGDRGARAAAARADAETQRLGSPADEAGPVGLRL